MMKNSTQQTKHIVYKHSSGNSNSMQNGGIHPSSSNTPYPSNDVDKEGYSAPFIPRSISYVDYSKQYFSKSDTSKSSANADALSTHQRSVASTSPIVATYDYSPFGQLIATSGTPELSPIQFSSEVFDPETALTYYNHRYYNPTDGRWLSRHPGKESASLNLYAFVNNAPNYLQDQLGLYTWLYFTKSNQAMDQYVDSLREQSLNNFTFKKCKESERTRVGYDIATVNGITTSSPVRIEYRSKEPNPNHTPTSNGCGAEGSLTGYIIPNYIPTIFDFTEACNNHDICYGTCGASKKSCDDIFLSEMLASCGDVTYSPINSIYIFPVLNEITQRKYCAYLAYGMYYKIVNIWGETLINLHRMKLVFGNPVIAVGVKLLAFIVLFMEFKN